ncbi:MAG: hypothetical protein NTY38_01335 [Acidobacteria bacterium]|nr:hypothetical protein [Acidobacteriota bacterium]
MHGMILFLLLAGGMLAAGPRNDAWTVIGPGGGGAQFLPAISPHDPNVVLVGCDMTGAYLTKDGGKSWRMFNLRGTPRLFVFDPLNPKVMYAGTIGLWRSRDGGATWELVYPAPSSVKEIVMADDHAGEELMVDGGAERVRALAIDPADSNVLYAVLGGRGGPGRLSVSRDFGASWKTAGADLPSGSMKIYVDPKSPAGDRTLYIAGAEGLAVVEAGKLRRQTAPAQLIDVSAGFTAHGKLVVYGVSRDAIAVSTDGGAEWKMLKPAEQFVAVATSLRHPEVAYASYGGRFHGVMKTTDSGATWQPVWKESAEKSPHVDDGWISTRFGTGWGENPLSLGVSPANPEIAWGTDYGRSLRTADGGKTWVAAYTRKEGRGWTTTGLDVTTNYGVHFDPFDANHMFISYTDIGLFSSADGGRSWNSATEKGVPRSWVNTTYWMEFDPAMKGRVWAVMSGTHDLPRPKMWRRGGTARYRGGVVRSDDGGVTWRAMGNGLPETAATHVLLDVRSKPQARVLYVTGFGRGVFKSSDGGESWQLKNEGLPAEPFAWRMSQDASGTLYLVLARRSDDGSIGTPGDGSLYRSTDGAESWRKMILPDNVNGPVALTIDGKDPRRLYLSAWSRPVEGKPVGGGIFVSTDGGNVWKRTLGKDQHVYDVTFHPKDPAVLYACGFESSAWRSTDRGEHWTRIRGYNFKWGHRVVPDPRNPHMVFVTTFGGSVWYGPAAGDPSAVEDIVTPVVAYGR